MKIYAIYKDNNFIVAFPTREEAKNYGKVVLGAENGWEYEIKEMWETIKYTFSQPLTITPQQAIPCKVSDVAYPFTIDYSKGLQAND